MSLQLASEQAFAVTGDLTFDTVMAICQQGYTFLSKQQADVVFDLHAVKKTDSAALALLLEWKGFARKRNINLTFVNVPSALLDVAKVSDLEQLLFQSS